jgi:hypothetical protein
MKNDRIWYKELLSLGFDKKSAKDEVFFELYGYEYFFMSLMLNKEILAEWSPTSGQVTLYRDDKEGRPFTMKIDSYNELIKLVGFYGKLPTKS